MSDSKKAFPQAGNSSIPTFNPLDIRIEGGLLIKDVRERGPLDTEAPADMLALTRAKLTADLDPTWPQSIDAEGLLQPIRVYKATDGVPTVVFGRHRLRAIRLVNTWRKERGEPPMQARAEVLARPDVAKIERAVFAENFQRFDITAVERNEAILYLAKRDVAPADIAKSVRVSEGHIKTVIAFYDKAHPKVAAALDANKLTMQAALKISRLPEDKQPEALATTLEAASSAGAARAGSKNADAAKARTEGRALSESPSKRELRAVMAAAAEKDDDWSAGLSAGLALALDDSPPARAVAVLRDVRKKRAKAKSS